MTMQHTTNGLDAERLELLTARVERDVEEERYDGAVIIVARHGEIGLHEAIGFAHRESGRAARRDDVFRIFSMTKAFTNALVLNAVDRGLLALTTPVADVVPEFLGTDRFRGMHKPRVTIAHLLTHRAALVPTPTPVPYEQLGDLSAVISAIGDLDLIGEPGERVQYSPALAHALLGEVVRRIHGADSFREVLDRELLEPLGMTSTRLGAPVAWADRLVPVVARFPEGGWLGPQDIEVMNDIIDEDAEMPWVGCVSAAGDVLRFAEMVRRGGELDGVRDPLARHPRPRDAQPDGRRAERALQDALHRDGLGRPGRVGGPRVHAARRRHLRGALRDAVDAADARQLRCRLVAVLDRPRSAS